MENYFQAAFVFPVSLVTLLSIFFFELLRWIFGLAGQTADYRKIEGESFFEKYSSEYLAVVKS